MGKDVFILLCTQTAINQRLALQTSHKDIY